VGLIFPSIVYIVPKSASSFASPTRTSTSLTNKRNATAAAAVPIDGESDHSFFQKGSSPCVDRR
jgi:hypothetical protein